MKTLDDRIEPLSRPQFVLTDIESFDSELKKAAGSNVKFDIFMGRTVLSDKSDKKAVFLRILELLGKDGRLVIAENVSSEGQRLSDFLDMKQFHSSLVDKFYAVERELFSEVSNPMVNWTVESIKKEFENMGDFNISVQAIVEHPVRRLKNGDIEFWFRTEDGSAKKSFGSRLSEKCTPDEVDKIRRMLHVKLDNKEIAWKTVTMIVNALRGD
jgi:putative ATPase